MIDWVHSWQLYQLLEKRGLMKSKSVLPDEGFGDIIIPLTRKWDPNQGYIIDDSRKFTIFCEPKGQKGNNSPHRIKVHCSCGQKIPFGRMRQHKHTEMINGVAQRILIGKLIEGRDFT